MDKKESLSLKAIAIILMFFHHLFGCKDYLTGDFTPHVINVLGPMDELIAMGGKICIPLFAFASGYGLYITYIKDAKYSAIIKSLIKFLIQYWVILFGVAVPYLLVTGNFDSKYIFINLFALLHNANYLYLTLSWYVKLHILFLLFCPVIKWASKYMKNIFYDVIFFVALPSIVSFFLKDYEYEYEGLILNTLSTIRLLLFWLPAFYAGVIFLKFDIFKRIRNLPFLKNYPLSIVGGILVMFSMVLIRSQLHNPVSIVEMFLAVAFVIGFDCFYQNIKYGKKFLEFLGKYSYQLWLLSSMFYFNTTELIWFLYKPTISILILIWNFVMLIPFAILTQKVGLILSNLILKNTARK